MTGETGAEDARGVFSGASVMNLRVTGLSRTDHILKPRGSLNKLSRCLLLVICHLLLVKLKTTNWGGEMVQQLRAQAPFPEDPGSLPRTDMTAHDCLNFSPRGSNTLLWLYRQWACT